MVLPVSLLQTAENNPVLVELKDGTTYNGKISPHALGQLTPHKGTLVNTDSFMNVNLKDVTCTSKEGTQFWKLPECYVRGSTIKYFRMSEDLLDQVPVETHEFKPRIGGNTTRGGGRGGERGAPQRGRGGGNTRGGGATRGGGGGFRGRGGAPRGRGGRGGGGGD